MATIKLKGPGLNDWFAEQLVKDHGADGARAKCCGPALAAVERVIARKAAEAEDAFNAEQAKNGGMPCGTYGGY